MEPDTSDAMAVVDPDAAVAEAATSATDLKNVTTKRLATLIDLPDELLMLILDHLYRELLVCEPFSRYKEVSAWFKYELAMVHPRLFRLLAPFRHTCLELGAWIKGEFERIQTMAAPSFSPNLYHLRNVRINFDEMQKCHTSAPIYLAHIWFIILTAVNLEYLELGDLLLNAGDGHSYGSAPYWRFSAANPLQFDLSCANLVRALPDIYGNFIGDRDGLDAAAFERLIDQYHHIVKPPSEGGPGIGFAQLKSVLLMDGNGGISIDDYANLFLIPRHLCRAGIAELHELSATRCSIWPDECRAVTACPALQRLTLVLWYDKLVINASFLHAMAHVAAHHPHLKRLDLVSRRLRYEPRLLDNKLTLNEWFKLDVLPVLQLADQLFAHKLELHIYILAKSQDRAAIFSAILRHQDHYANLVVKCLDISEATPTEVYTNVVQLHREEYSAKLHEQASQHQGIARLRVVPYPHFLFGLQIDLFAPFSPFVDGFLTFPSVCLEFMALQRQDRLRVS